MAVLVIALAAGFAAWLIYLKVESRRRSPAITNLEDAARANRKPAASQKLHSQGKQIGASRGPSKVFGIRREGSRHFVGWSVAVRRLSLRLNRTGDQPTGQIDYAAYRLSLGEIAIAWLSAGSVWFFIGLVFYGTFAFALLLSLLGLAFPAYYRKKLLEKRKSELAEQFKQALFSLSSSLTAGKSVENAFQEVVKDLKVLYVDPQTYIISEFERINMRIRNGETVEQALHRFSERTDLEDIRNFADVFMICTRSGGNLVEVIRRTAQIIGEKTEIKREIAVTLSQKRFESKVMSMAPVVVVGVLSWSSPDYMAPLYHGSGRIIMTAALILLLFCYWLTQKIMNVKV